MPNGLCCFTGHRYIEPSLLPLLRARLRKAAEDLALGGIGGFICGGALGFDTIAAETVLRLKNRLPELTLTLVLPYRGQSDRWSRADRERYAAIMDMADEVICLSEEYTPYCMIKRNRFMVERSSVCVCWLTQASGGTAYTVSYAASRGLKVINLAMGLQTALGG